MRTAKLPSLGVAAVLLIALSVACGDGEEPQIRTERGLGIGLVSLAAERLQEAERDAGAQDSVFPGQAPATGEVAWPGLMEGLGASLLAQSQVGVTVPGYGLATVDADSAILELYFTRFYTEPQPDGGTTRPGAETPAGTLGPITETDLQPVIDAIVSEGVAREDIQFLGGTYYDPYSSSAALRVTERNLDLIDGVVSAATAAADTLLDIVLQSTSISYTVQDCAALERAAMDAAVADANERAAAFAGALGVELGGIAGASDYAYSPFGGTPCSIGYMGPVPVGGVTYSQSQAREVQVYANVSITYAIE